MSGFMVLLFYIAVLLSLVNTWALVPLIDKICRLYGIDYGSRDIICLIVLMPMSLIYMYLTLSSRMHVSLGLYNNVGLAFLIQIGILVVTVLANKLVNKVYYKCNVKPYLQIKL